jgi:hypothetical protein
MQEKQATKSILTQVLMFVAGMLIYTISVVSKAEAIHKIFSLSLIKEPGDVRRDVQQATRKQNNVNRSQCGARSCQLTSN